MNTILVIEDNKDLSSMVKESLESEGYIIHTAFSGVEGISKIKNNSYDLIVLDIMLPYKSGDQILRETRSFSQVPIIIISAKDMISTKIDLLKLGADDYITKPFDLQELEARIETLLRRCKNTKEPSKCINYKDMLFYPEKKEIVLGDMALDLTVKEFHILSLLLLNQEKVFTRANLYESVWKEEYMGDDNTIKTHISNLRSKLKRYNPSQDYIETVWGLGYRLYKE